MQPVNIPLSSDSLVFGWFCLEIELWVRVLEFLASSDVSSRSVKVLVLVGDAVLAGNIHTGEIEGKDMSCSRMCIVVV